VLTSIQAGGYQRERYGTMLGYFLTDGSDYRFVIGSGNHRVSILKALGHRRVLASLNHSHPAVIHEQRLSSWSRAVGGPFDEGTAEALFGKLFLEDGLDKARNLGLVGS
jgi:hypothetical protein